MVKRLLALVCSSAILVPMFMPAALPIVATQPAQAIGVPVGLGCNFYRLTTAEARACVKRHVVRHRMNKAVRDCLLGAVGTAFGIGVGALIDNPGAINIARAVVGGSAGSCLTIVMESL